MDKPPPKPTATVRFRRVPTADGRTKFVRVGGPWPPPRPEASKKDGKKDEPRPKPKKKVEASKPASTAPSGVWIVMALVPGGAKGQGCMLTGCAVLGAWASRAGR